jgi:hypothetical protein
VMDEQIKSKMEVVQARNAKISELNANMSGMNAAVAKLGTGADAELSGANLTAFLAAAPQELDTAAMNSRAGVASNADAFIQQAPINGSTANRVRYLKEEMVKQGYPVSTTMASLPTVPVSTQSTPLSAANVEKFVQECRDFSAWLKNPDSPPTMPTDPKAAQCTTRGQAEAYVKSIQTQIDSLGNTQQMDMLNLQSTSNKRNEAFEIMTNFMKKFNDSRAGIIQKF